MNRHQKTTIFIASVFIVFACVMFFCQKGINTPLKEDKPLDWQFELILIDDKTTFTAYTLSPDETDSTPCIGAGNNNLCELRPILRENGITICASRDLPLDTLIYINGFGECIIKDRMNKRYKGTGRIDILMDTKTEAIKFGKRELSYKIIK